MPVKCPYCGASGGSGGRPPGVVDAGVAVLVLAGMTEGSARTMIGKLISEYGGSATAAAVGMLSWRARDKTQEPLADARSYLSGLLKAHPSRNGTKTGAHAEAPWKAEWIRQLDEEIASEETGLVRRQSLIAFRDNLPRTTEEAREQYKAIQ